MTDETTLAATLGETETKVETPVSDGIIDLDGLEEVKPQTTDEEVEAAKAKDAETKPEPETDEEKKKLSGAARAKIREARLLGELQAREREIEDLRRTQPADKTASEAKPPREEDYNGDWFAWQRALTAHEAGVASKAAIRKEFETREQSERSTKQAEIARERSVAHLERVEDAREVIADFDTVMKAMDGVKVRNEVIDEIMSSDNSAAISYHLAKNPAELQAMDSMSARELARAMGRLEATVRLPSPKMQTTAPPPLSTVKGGASPSSAEGDLAKWMKKTYG